MSWPGTQIERITKEAEGARREAAAQRALARTLAEAQALAEEEGLRQEAAIKDLRNELADKEVALQNAQRKLFQARASRWAFAFLAAGYVLRAVTCRSLRSGGARILELLSGSLRDQKRLRERTSSHGHCSSHAQLQNMCSKASYNSCCK